ncbi:hypothetical protein Ga0451573_003960, partial [Peptococcaceae bacterium DYL19]|nr:hypothetical protein [Phosphitispora fastidiosa]
LVKRALDIVGNRHIGNNIENIGAVLIVRRGCARNGDNIRAMRGKHVNHPEPQT